MKISKIFKRGKLVAMLSSFLFLSVGFNAELYAHCVYPSVWIAGKGCVNKFTGERTGRYCAYPLHFVPGRGCVR